MTDARRQADDAIARYLRLEASIHTLQNLSDAERALLQGVLPDVDDLAVLRAAFRCEREEGKGRSVFTAAPAFSLARRVVKSISHSGKNGSLSRLSRHLPMFFRKMLRSLFSFTKCCCNRERNCPTPVCVPTLTIRSPPWDCSPISKRT